MSADPRAGAPALVDVAAYGERRRQRARSRRRAPASRGSRRRPTTSQWPLRRRVEDQHRALRAMPRAPRWPRRPRGRSSSPTGSRECPRRGRRTSCPRSRQTRRGGLSPRSQAEAASRSASSVSLFPGTSTVGVSIARQRADRLLEALMDRGEVARSDHDVGFAAPLDERGGAPKVAMEVEKARICTDRDPTSAGKCRLGATFRAVAGQAARGTSTGEVHPFAIRLRSAAATSSNCATQDPRRTVRGVTGRAARAAATAPRNAMASAALQRRP